MAAITVLVENAHPISLYAFNSICPQLLSPEQVRESCGMSMVQIMEKYKLACV